MSNAVQITSFIKNLLGEENTEECLNTATLIKAERYNWKRYSKPLAGQTLKEHKKWLEVWQRLELTDMYYFPLWEKGVHDLLQKHFSELSLIFLAYCRSLLGSDSAEDAMEMEMAEFKDFVDECGLETKQVNFDLMTTNFIKVSLALPTLLSPVPVFPDEPMRAVASLCRRTQPILRRCEISTPSRGALPRQSWTTCRKAPRRQQRAGRPRKRTV